MIDREEFFEEYHALVSQADRAFLRVKGMHPELVCCEISCSDCCYAFFELTPIEAVYLNEQFHRSLSRQKRREILRRAQRADTHYRQIKERLHQAVVVGGVPQEAAMDQVGRERVACPLLNERNQCDLYTHRPITCRLYGIPTLIGGAARTCGRSGFQKGGSYPTANLDLIQERLLQMSEKLMRAKGANRWMRIDGLVLVSTALMWTLGQAPSCRKGEP